MYRHSRPTRRPWQVQLGAQTLCFVYPLNLHSPHHCSPLPCPHTDLKAMVTSFYELAKDSDKADRAINMHGLSSLIHREFHKFRAHYNYKGPEHSTYKKLVNDKAFWRHALVTVHGFSEEQMATFLTKLGSDTAVRNRALACTMNAELRRRGFAYLTPVSNNIATATWTYFKKSPEIYVDVYQTWAAQDPLPTTADLTTMLANEMAIKGEPGLPEEEPKPKRAPKRKPCIVLSPRTADNLQKLKKTTVRQMQACATSPNNPHKQKGLDYLFRATYGYLHGDEELKQQPGIEHIVKDPEHAEFAAEMNLTPPPKPKRPRRNGSV